MKTRLLPPQSADDSAPESGSASVPYERRTGNGRIALLPDQQPATTQRELHVVPEPNVVQVSSRPRGRIFALAVLLACLGFAGFSIWNSFLRYRAHGIVEGDTVEISPPWRAALETLFVRPGDAVNQGDLLAVVVDPELDASISELGDQVRVAQAELDAQVALLAVAAQEKKDKFHAVLADNYELQGELLLEQAKLDELSSKLERNRELAESRAITSEELESLVFAEESLRGKIESLKQAITATEQRIDVTKADADVEARLKPWIAKIEHLQAEIRRLREKQQRGFLRSPITGKVVTVSRQVGERTEPDEAILELLENGSLEVVVYVRENQLTDFEVGQSVRVIFEPARTASHCEVLRFGERFVAPISHIEDLYPAADRLLPVYLKPPADLPRDVTLRVGGTVRVPAIWLPHVERRS